MKKLLHFTLLLLLAGIFTACPKKSDPEPVDPKTTLLINKQWRATADVSVTTTGAGVSTTVDNYAKLAACGKDDFIRFDDKGILTIDEGPSRCAAPDPQTVKGTWSWNADRTVITFTEPCLCQDFNSSTLSGAADLTSSTLVVKQSSTSNGNTTVRTVTYGSI